MFSLLTESKRGALVLRGARERANIAVCFAEAPSSTAAVTPDGMVLLDARLGDAEAAARLGHLLHHVSRGFMGVEPRAEGCEAAAREALAEEARALAFEVELRRALHVHGGFLKYEFEEAFFREAPGAREALIERYLLDHPDGAPGLDALATGYARRCRERRR